LTSEMYMGPYWKVQLIVDFKSLEFVMEHKSIPTGKTSGVTVVLDQNFSERRVNYTVTVCAQKRNAILAAKTCVANIVADVRNVSAIVHYMKIINYHSLNLIFRFSLHRIAFVRLVKAHALISLTVSTVAYAHSHDQPMTSRTALAETR